MAETRTETKNTAAATEVLEKLTDLTRPSADWTLERLGEFARSAVRRSAAAAWEMGRAFVIAKEKTNKRRFGKWVSEYVPHLSGRTIQRYMKVGRLDYDDVRTRPLADIYRVLFGDDYDRKKPATPTKLTEQPTTDQIGAPTADPADESKPVEGEATDPTAEGDPILEAINVLGGLTRADWTKYRAELIHLIDRLTEQLAQYS